MSPEQLKELASALAKAEVLTDWKFYAMWAAVTLLSAAAGAYLGSYWKKRGEHAATKADFDELIKQLKATTEAAEGVRTQLAHEDWAQREWKTLRRTKGEELIEEANRAQEAFKKQGAQYLFSEITLTEQLGRRVYTLSLLYFPEALIPSIQFAALLDQGTNLLLDIRTEMMNEGVPVDSSRVRSRRLQEVLQHTDRFARPLDEIREIVKTCVWRAYGLPDYVHDHNAAIAALEALGNVSIDRPTPPPAHTPSVPDAMPSPAPGRADR